MKKICSECGDYFLADQPRNQKFCSKSCRMKSIRANYRRPAYCATCRKLFYKLQGSGRKYCSYKCKIEAYAIKSTSKNVWVAKVCIRCKKEFQSYAVQHIRYCSWDCYLATFSDDKRVTISCTNCNRKFSYLKTRPKKFCSLECYTTWMSVNRSGDNNANWKGGYSGYYGPSWLSARRAARLRDKRCQDCGKTPKQLGYSLHVHHIIPFRLFGVERHLEANALSNLKCLCNPCHGRQKIH